MTDENDKELSERRAQIALIADATSVWGVPGIEVEPEIVLVRWQIRRVLKSHYAFTQGDHFVGWNATHSEGRVSTTITQFDPTTGLGITQSGRAYQLRGPAGQDLDAAHVWRAWCRRAAIDETIDVTAEYVTLLARAKA